MSISRSIKRDLAAGVIGKRKAAATKLMTDVVMNVGIETFSAFLTSVVCQLEQDGGFCISPRKGIFQAG